MTRTTSVEWDLTADRYEGEFELLAALSKQAVGEHRLEATAARAGRGPRKKRIDRQLFEDLTDLRERLSKDISRRNPTAVRDESELDEAVQRLLDRLVFIRVTEDRDMESPVLLPILREESGLRVLERLRVKFREFDALYDSRLFQGRATGFEAQLIDRLDVGDDILRDSIKRLHWSEGGVIRYDFAAMDADVLGMMYEQYLGMLLRKTAKGASLRDGAAQRNERGIFYTPTWVVNYIVKLALETALRRKGATAAKLRVLDLACGSGSFLIRAFEEMRLLRNPSGGAVQSRFDSEVERLPYAVRVAILKENLFGVDLDPKAVEIAQLNLMIRALERRQKIPALDRNVISRDSLIEDPSVSPRGRPWAEMFPAIMAEGGFDAIVGNPPYVPFQSLSNAEEQYFRAHFATAKGAMGNYDIYVLFVERALELLKDGGVAGFILPNKFLNAEYGRGLRRLLSEKRVLFRLLDFRDYQVFDGVTTYTCLLFVRKASSPKLTYGRLRPGTDPGATRILRDEDFDQFDTKVPSDAEKPWNFILPEEEALFHRLERIPRKLGDVAAAVFQGLKTGNDKVFFVHRLREDGDIAVVRNGLGLQEHRIESQLLRPLLKGREARRWGANWGERYVVCPYEVAAGKVRLIPLSEVQQRFPATYRVLPPTLCRTKGTGSWSDWP